MRRDRAVLVKSPGRGPSLTFDTDGLDAVAVSRWLRAVSGCEK